MDDSALLKQFVAEAAELVESLQADLDRLAEQHASGRVNPELLNRIFRAAHSIKGMAGMAGLEEIRGVAHRFEDLLDDMRMGRYRPGPAALASFSEVAEGLGQLVSSAGRGAGREPERLTSLIDSLREERPETKAEDPADVVDLDETVRRTLTEYEEHRLLENIRDRRPLYEVRVAFDLMTFDSGFRALNEELTSTGEVISTLPGAGAADPMQIAFRIIYATDDAPETIGERAARFDAEAALISHYPEPEPEPVAVETAPEPAVDATAPSVRVEMRELDQLAVLAQRLALRTSELLASYTRLVEPAALSARQQFDLKQRTRVLERGFLELEERLVELRLVPLGPSFARARRLVRRVATELEKEAELVTRGEDVRLDKAIVDHIAEPLSHLLSNALAHGIEMPETRAAAGKPRAGAIVLSAEPSGSRVVIAVSDDGRGLDVERIRRVAEERGLGALAAADPFAPIFEPGFSTASSVSSVSGRGVGLDAVAASIRALGGEVGVASEPGQGTTFLLTLPTTLVLVSAFLVETNGIPYAVDVNHLSELGLVDPAEVRREGARQVVDWRGERVPFVSLADLLRLPPRSVEGRKLPCLIARAGERVAAIAVDRFVEERETVVKSLGRYAPKLKGVTGALDLEGGRVALLLDMPGLLAQEVSAW